MGCCVWFLCKYSVNGKASFSPGNVLHVHAIHIYKHSNHLPLSPTLSYLSQHSTTPPFYPPTLSVCLVDLTALLLPLISINSIPILIPIPSPPHHISTTESYLHTSPPYHNTHTSHACPSNLGYKNNSLVRRAASGSLRDRLGAGRGTARCGGRGWRVVGGEGRMWWGGRGGGRGRRGIRGGDGGGGREDTSLLSGFAELKEVWGWLLELWC